MKVRVPEAAVKSLLKVPVSASAPLIEVAKSTVSAACALPVRMTVKVIIPPSVAFALAIAKLGAASSLLMVPVAVPVPMFAPAGPPDALLRVTVKVSLASNSVSCVVCTVNVLLRSP